jgi:hypothetical protein
MIVSGPVTPVVMSGAERPADAAAGADVDKAVHRSGVESILAGDEFRMQDDVALLRRGRLEIGQALPGFEIPGAHEAGHGDGAGEIVRPGVGILRLGAEHAVDAAVLVERDAHVVHVGLGFDLRQVDGLVPKAPVVDPVGALGDGEDALAIVAFEADDQVHLAPPENAPGLNVALTPRRSIRNGLVLGLRSKRHSIGAWR